MLFVVHFEDGPTGADLRRRHVPDHPAFPSKALKVRAAGPVSAATVKARAPVAGRGQRSSAGRGLVRQIRLGRRGCEGSDRILLWTQVFADSSRLLAP